MFFYHLFIRLYPFVAWLIHFFNPKADLWLKGRKGLFKKLSATFHNNKKPVIWLHAASLGEFEQGLPLLEDIRKNYPEYLIVITFFSPSGYEIRKDHPIADHVFYLPMDSALKANRFFNIVQPSLVLFVKYEFWYYYLKEAHHREIPVLLISGIFRKDQLFFKWYGNVYRKMLGFFSKIFVQTLESETLIKHLDLKEPPIISGDTRFDRVLTIAENFTSIPLIEQFCEAHQVIIAGSTWTEDDEALEHFVNTYPEIRFIIAPHDVGEERIAECQKLYKHNILYSDFESLRLKNSALPEKVNTLIINNIGMLSRMYHYATISYVGGGFGDDGIHNVLEAAVHGKPVVFGPVYDKYFEASELLDSGGGISVNDALELESELNHLLKNVDDLTMRGEQASNYVKTKAGATQKVMDYIEAKRLLTN